jgi:hypothetical protein
MMIKNKPRKASKRMSRGFFTTGPGTPGDPDLSRRITAKHHNNRILFEAKPFGSAYWTFLVLVPASSGETHILDRMVGTG